MSSLIDLGARLDEWSAAGSVAITETEVAVTISRLTASQVDELRAFAGTAGCPTVVTDPAHELVDSEADDDFGPFIAVVQKTVCSSATRILTVAGLEQALLRPDFQGVWQVAAARLPFTTGLASVHPWGAGDVYSPAPEKKSPRDLVRERTAERVVPADIRRWLIRGDITAAIWTDPAFAVFARLASPALVRSLASEVAGRTEATFNGPPRLTVTINERSLSGELEQTGFAGLQAAASWVYEDVATSEQRHALVANEMARSLQRHLTLGAAIQSAVSDVLDGARLAFQLSQADLSREALKAQTDLRKAIADDTAKVADGTRTLAGAMALAVATGLGLVATRATTTSEPWVLRGIAAVAGTYLIVVALSGWLYLRNQERLRGQWRKRLYRFIPKNDYEAMVTLPIREAELPYHLVGVVAVIISLCLFGLALRG